MDESPVRFQVAISVAQQEQLVKEDKWALQHGLREEYRTALRELNYRHT